VNDSTPLTLKDETAGSGTSAEATLVCRVGLVLCLVVVGWFYVWTARSSNDDWHFGREQTDYYNFMIHGWLDGHLYMKVDVPEALLRVQNPYDPAQRSEGLGLHDTSFYRGKYYLYFGVAPAVVAMLPFRMLTGTDLPLPATVVMFTYFGFLASVASFWYVRRHYFPKVGWIISYLCTLALGFAALGPVLIRRPEVWELPIASGYCFFMLALRCLLSAAHSRSWRWQFVTSLCLGLAVASRPTYLVALPVLLLPLLRRRREASPAVGLLARLGGWQLVAVTVIPLALVGVSLAWHNYARFGNPLEFGQKYQLSSMYESKLVHFSPRYLPVNAWLYFVAPAHLSRYFPFLSGITTPRLPSGYGGFADVYGVFSNLPFALAAFAVPFALRKRSSKERVTFGIWLASVGVALVGIVMLILCFFGAHARYMLDFTPTLMLLAVVGVLTIENETLGLRSRWRPIARLPWITALIYSVAFAAIFSLSATNEFNGRRPGDYEKLGRALNYLPWSIERAFGVRHGPITMTVRFVPEIGKREALVTTGTGDEQDTVFVEYTADNRVRFGGLHVRGPVQLSQPLTLDIHQSHRICVMMGSLLPPAIHPLFREIAPETVTRWTTRLVVACDDEVVLDAAQPFYGEALRAWAIGAAPGVGSIGRFRGEIVQIKRGDLTVGDLNVPPRKCVRLRLQLASDMPARQPLLSLGSSSHGDLIYVRRGEQGEFRIGWTAATGETRETGPLLLAADAAHEIEFMMAAPELRAGLPLRAAFQLYVDGQSVWPFSDGPVAAADTTIVVAENAVNAPTCEKHFAGKVFSQERFLEDADPLAYGSGIVKLKLRFPRPFVSRREPLLVTGRYGAGDFFFVEYVDDRTIRLGFDHWGDRLLESAPLLVDGTAVHDIEISIGSLLNATSGHQSDRTGSGVLRVTLDGQMAWQQPASFYWPATGEVFVAKNPLGGSSCEARFSGSVFNAERTPAVQRSATPAQK
jgi:hypothetical protein